jgi:CBS domain-containing protein
MSRVADLMSQPVLRASPELTLERAAQLMIERSVGAVVVTRGDAVTGILTERDILRSVARGLVPWTTKVSECMSAHPSTLTPSDSLDDAMWLMRQGRFRHLPVVEGGALVGILSLRDLFRAEPDAWPTIRSAPDDRISPDTMGPPGG